MTDQAQAKITPEDFTRLLREQALLVDDADGA